MNKTLAFASLILIVSFFSCKKDSSPVVTKTKTELLTSNTWKYNEYYRSYNGTTGTLFYKRGSSGNLIDLDQNRVTFYANGTYSELSETGLVYAGTWQFANNETQVQIYNSTGTYVSNVIALDQTSYNWLDPGTSGGTFGKMVPQ